MHNEKMDYFICFTLTLGYLIVPLISIHIWDIIFGVLISIVNSVIFGILTNRLFKSKRKKEKDKHMG